MTDAPERIWADPPETFDGMDIWRSEAGGKGIPYILATPAALARAPEVQALVTAAVRRAFEAQRDRPTFPILNGLGARIDYQLVSDHAKQAHENHGQTVKQLAERGGLSWCELYAVLHNKPWKKIDGNDAMIACRALEARYLRAIAADPADVRRIAEGGE